METYEGKTEDLVQKQGELIESMGLKDVRLLETLSEILEIERELTKREC